MHIESSFHHCAGPVKLVQTSLGDMKDMERIFHRCGSLAKLVQASLGVRNDVESIFHHSGGKSFSQLWRSCAAHASLFVRWDIESSFLPLSRSCEGRAGHFGWQEKCRRHFHYCRSPAEIVHASLGVQEDPKSSFHHRAGLVNLWHSIFSTRKDMEKRFHCYGTQTCLF